MGGKPIILIKTSKKNIHVSCSYCRTEKGFDARKCMFVNVCVLEEGKGLKASIGYG